MPLYVFKVCTGSGILEKVLKLAQQLIWKNGKKSRGFFFKAVARALQVILSLIQPRLNVCSDHEKSFIPAVLKVFLKCIYAIIVLNNSCFLFSVLGLLYDESLYDSVVNIPTTAAPINGTVVPTTSS